MTLQSLNSLSVASMRGRTSDQSNPPSPLPRGGIEIDRMFRDRMLNIPDRVVGALVAELREAIIAIGVDPEVVKGLDLGKVHGILTAEIRSALEEFADAAHR